MAIPKILDEITVERGEHSESKNRVVEDLKRNYGQLDKTLLNIFLQNIPGVSRNNGGS